MNAVAIERGRAVLDDMIAKSPRKPASSLRVTDLHTLIAASLPEPEPILPPFLFAGDLAMIYAARGAGKTWFAGGISYAIASRGSFVGWQCTRARKVLFLDGEMRASRLRKRFSLIIAGADQEAEEGMLRILTRDLCGDSLDWPDLGTVDGRMAIADLIEAEQPEVIVLDNLSSWIRSGGRENDEESWREVASFLMTQRTRNRAVILVHHAGKSGMQRGTSKREDILDTVVKLQAPADYAPTDGMRCEVIFEKSRNLDGGDVPSLLVDLNTTGGKAVFTATSAQTDVIARVSDLIKQGATRNEICKATNMDRFALVRLHDRARALGRGFDLPDARTTANSGRKP